MRRKMIIDSLTEGAFKNAYKRERDPETAKEWAQDAILKACIEFDRYAHLPDLDLTRLLGMVIKNHILYLQRKEVEKDKRNIRLSDEFDATVPDKVCDDGAYEPYLHHVAREPREPDAHPPTEWEGQESFTLTRELMAILEQKCNDRDTRRFIREKLNPSPETRALMQVSGVEHPYDNHIFPNHSKATISRIKNRIRHLVEVHGYEA